MTRRAVLGMQKPNMVLKPGGLEAIKKSGPRPACKIPYGLHSAAIPLKKMNKNGAVRYLFRLLDYRLLIHNKHLKL